MTDRRVVVVDGSNLATEGRTTPSLQQLDEAVRAYAAEDPDAEIVVVVDASFEHRVDASEREALEEAELHGEVVSPPAGAIGRGDAFVLRIAERTGAMVLSNDSFQEFHAEHPWLFDEGRLVGGKPVPGVGWIFTPRIPVRGPKSRQATSRARRAAASVEPLTPPAKAAELARAARKAAAKRMAVMPDGSVPKVGDVWQEGRPGSPEAVHGEAPAPGAAPAGEREGAAASTNGEGPAGAEERPAKRTRKRAATKKAAAKQPARAPEADEGAAGEGAAGEGPAGTEPAGAEPAEPTAEVPGETGVPGGVPGKSEGSAKKAPAKKAATKKQPAAKKAVTKKAAAEKTPAEKAATKKTTKKAAAEKAPAEKAPAKKAAAKKAAAKKAAAKKAAPASGEGLAEVPPPDGEGAVEPAGAAGPPEVAIDEPAAPGTSRRGTHQSRPREDPELREAIDEATAEALGPPAEEPPATRGGAAAGASGARQGEDEGEGRDARGSRRRRRRPAGSAPAVNEPLAFITFVAAHPVGTELEGEVVSFTSHGAMVDVDLPDGGILHCYIPLTAMAEPPPTKARQVLTRGERRAFVLVGLDPPRRVAELALPGVPAAAELAGEGR